MCRFNTITTKISTGFFVDINSLILNSIGYDKVIETVILASGQTDGMRELINTSSHVWMCDLQ
jgi:hypothetical protein